MTKEENEKFSYFDTGWGIGCIALFLGGLMTLFVAISFFWILKALIMMALGFFGFFWMVDSKNKKK